MGTKTRLIRLSGHRFGVLTVLGRAGSSGRGNATWWCECECGRHLAVRGYQLRKRVSQRCWHKDDTGKPEYAVWCRIKNRCNNPKYERYANYGGRGIQVCDRWVGSFANFFADMGSRPSTKHSIDRIDNNGNYEPGNCRWSTTFEQARNRRNTIFVEQSGVKVKLSDLIDGMGLDRRVIYGRLKLGWSLGDALSVPVNKHKPRQRVVD